MRFPFLAAAFAAALTLCASPVLANETTTTQQYAQGQQVQASDLMGDIEGVRNFTGITASLILGSQNALPNTGALAVTLSNTAMTFSVGGAGQYIIAQDALTSLNSRMMDSCPQQTITIPANSSGSARTDLLSVQYIQIPVNGHTVSFSNGSVQTVYQASEGCQYNYTTGTTTPPVGYVAFAQISVPSGATTSSQATVTYQIQTVGSLLSSQLGTTIPGAHTFSGTVTFSAAPVGPNGGTFLDTSSTGQTKTGNITAGSLTSNGGVAVGGAVSGASSITFSSAGSLSSSAVGCENDGGATAGLLCNVPSGSTNGYRFQAAGATKASISATGQLSALSFSMNSTTATNGTLFNSGHVNYLSSYDSSNGGFSFVNYGNTGGAPVSVGSLTSSGGVTGAGITSTAGVAAGGAITGATTISASSTATAGGFVSTATTGLQIPNAISGSTGTQLGTGGASVATVPSSALYVYTPGTSGLQELAIDGSGNMGIANSLHLPGTIYSTQAPAGTALQVGAGNTYSNALSFSNQSGVGTGYTFIGANSSVTIDTVSATLMYFGVTGGSNLITFDSSGSIGLAGTVHAASSRKVKRDIAPMTDDQALDLARKTSLIQFCYKMESPKSCGPKGGVPFHVSFIAENTPAALAGNQHNQVEPVTLAAVALGAARAIDKRLLADERREAIDKNTLQVHFLEIGLASVVAYLIAQQLRARRRQ